MNAALPKPTPPQSKQPKDTGVQPVGNNAKTVYQTPPAGKPAAVPPVAPPIQLGGKKIPVPVNKPVQSSPSQPLRPPMELRQPTAPLPQAQEKPDDEKAKREKAMGINPALAPKAAPLISPAGTPPPTQSGGSTPLPTKPAPAAPKLAGVKQPIFAQIQANPKKWLLIILGAVLGISLLVFLVSRIFGGSSSPADQSSNTPAAPVKQTVLTYWGLWEPSAVLEEVISDYEAANPGISIDYRVQSHKDYRERLQTAIASGNGPDIFRFHAAWVPMLQGDLAVLPASVMSASDFQNTFYPAASQQLQVDGKIVGLPIMYDGLVLYYNKDILQTAGVEPPATWAEMKQLASELTVPADKNQRRSSGIQRSGLAIGNAANVDHFSDILALLILQNGGDPSQAAFTEVRDALLFYTNFVKEDVVWSSALPNSTVAFARGDAAMMFAPSWRAHEIMEMNPDLNFSTAPVPQLSDETIAWANYWAEGVNERSANKTAAWQFLKYLTTAEVMQKLYSAQSQVRAFGEPYSRQDLASSLQDDPYVGAVLKDAPNASGWFMSSATHDNGLNDNITNYYAAAVNSLLGGGSIDEVLDTLDQGVTQELRQYGQAQ